MWSTLQRLQQCIRVGGRKKRWMGGGSENQCIVETYLPCTAFTQSLLGIFFVLPCIETYQKVDLRTITLDVPPQEVIFKGSVHLFNKRVSAHYLPYFSWINLEVKILFLWILNTKPFSMNSWAILLIFWRWLGVLTWAETIINKT